jgi:ankyrin repeat protein
MPIKKLIIAGNKVSNFFYKHQDLLAYIASVPLVIFLLIWLWTPKEQDIWGAVINGNIELIKHHLEEGVDVDSKNEYGKTPLSYAISFLKIDTVEFLISKGANVNLKGEFKNSPLHEATSGGDQEIVSLLLNNGADVNAKSNNGRTPLHDAAWEGHKEIAELLIANGAGVNAKEDDGTTPLDRIESLINDQQNYSLKPLADLLRKHGGKRGSIFNAVEYGNIETVRELLANGVDVNTKDNSGRTPLDWAENHIPEIYDLLRKHGGKTAEELKAEGK